MALCNIKFNWHFLFVTLPCSVAFAVQLWNVLSSGYISPTLTNTVVEQRDLHHMDFPLVFKICIKPGFNVTAVREMGYKTIYYYFTGTSWYNDSVVGWAGHTRAGGVQGSVEEVLTRVRTHSLESLGEIIYGIEINDKYSVNMTANMHLRSINFPDNCYLLDLYNNGYVAQNEIVDLVFYFYTVENYSVEIQTQGRSMASKRNLKDETFFSSGEPIRLASLAGTVKSYAVKIKENNYVEEDKSKECRNYPNPDFATYDDCDDNYMKNRVNTLDPNLVPIWLADDLANVTTQMDTNAGRVLLILTYKSAFRPLLTALVSLSISSSVFVSGKKLSV
jgi:hypothetical protein